MKTWKKVISFVLAVVCIVSLMSTMSLSASAATANVSVSEVKGVTLQNVKTGEYLNFDYGTLKNGQPVRVWPWDGTTEQIWSIVCVSGTTYRIVTYKSNKYALDIYRGSSALKASQQADIWTAGEDAKAQNVQFYLCDDGSYIIRMADNNQLALSATSSKGRVKLAKFDSSSSAQKWVFRDTQGNKIDIQTGTTTVSSGIPVSSFKKTGVTYTVSGAKYYEAKTTKAYNGVETNSVFFVDSNNKVVTDADILNKLYSLNLFNSIREMQKGAAEGWLSAADDYFAIYTNIAATEKMGQIIGKGSGALLSIGAGNALTLKESLIELGDEVVSLETLKAASFISLLRYYTNNTVAYGNQAVAAMSTTVTDYDAMVSAANAYAECSASFSAVEFLIGDQIHELADSTTLKELGKYFDNVVVSFADAIIPDIKAVEVTKALTDGFISLSEMAVNCGASSVHDTKLVEQKEYLSKSYAGAKTVADKLAKAETAKFVKALTSKYTTNVTTQKWAAYYAGNGYHLGVDLGTNGNQATDVVSIADGVVYRVVKESQSGGWGNFVIVKHTLPNGKVFYSGYAHLKSMSVKEGTTVSAGTKLGVMGSTGYSTGPHLHLLCFSGNFSKSSLPKGYVSKKITGDSYTVGGLTYYDPLKVISTNGSIIN